MKQVKNGHVHLNYSGMGKIEPISIAHAQWFATLASQLSPEQVRRAFEASGASPQEIEGFSTRFLQKIQELQAAIPRE